MSKKDKNTYNDPTTDDMDEEYDEAVAYLASIGVPISPTGSPLGIGWDD